MSEIVIVYNGNLTIVTCWCGCKHAVPEELRNFQLRKHADGQDYFVHCPLGHMYAPSGESRADALERQLVKERASHDQTRALANEERKRASKAERQKKALRGVVTRQRNKQAKGECPCCGEKFVNVAHHMKNQHPEFVTNNTITEAAK